MKTKVQNTTLAALMAAVICIAGPIVIPVGMVPVSFVNLAIYLTILLLDKKMATISVVIYLLIGMIGMPVFSGFTAGAGKLFGPTGGYLIGYPVLSWIAGFILEKKKDSVKTIINRNNRCGVEEKIKKDIVENREVKKEGKSIEIRKWGYQMLALGVGTLVLYLIGTLWLMYQSNLSFGAALSIGIVPFILLDVGKIIAAVILGNAIKVRIKYIV